MPDRDLFPGPSAGADGLFDSPSPVLSDRQCEVLGLAALGLADKEIAREMSISVYTVGDHLRAARASLGARNTTHAVVLALCAGLLPVDGISDGLLSGLGDVRCGGGKGG